MKKLAALTLSLFLCVGTALADSPKDTPKDPDAQPAKSSTAAKPAAAKTNAEIAAEMEELRQALQAQQEQLQMLKEELAKRDREIEAAREAAAAANSRASEANVKATAAEATSNEVKSTAAALNTSVADLAASNAAIVNSSVAAPADGKPPEEKGPATIHFKGIDITPGGFIEAATINRQRALSSDINTPFTSIPFSGNSTGKLTEMNFSARQSRLSLLFGANVGSTKLTGYYEADFLGAGTTSNNRQSNSYVFRQRQLWARADFAEGWAFSAGQMWSLATENRKGIANRAEWFPAMIDPQYVVGYTWQRADAVRLAKSFGDKFTLAVSAEGPQTTLGGRGFSSVTTAIAGTAATTTAQNFFVFAPGAGGGLYNAFDTTGYSINKTPDFVVKAALDPGWGHYEVFGIVSEFRNRVYPCAVVSIAASSADGTKVLSGTNVATGTGGATCTNTAPAVTGALNDSRTGGGGGFHFHGPVFNKKLDVGATGFYGDGTGRFGSAQLADATVRPDGTLSLIRGGHWLGSLDWHVSPKLDVYGYVGGEFARRAAYVGYTTVAITTTPAVPGCGAAGQPACVGVPAGTVQGGVPAVSTYKVTLNGIGGYGSPFANNSGCATETLPTGNGTPGGGGSCAGDIRYIGEGTLGFWHKLYQGEKGRMQWGIQYSYFYKTAFSGSNGLTGTTVIAPHAVDNMVWTSFRYYIP